ncbi:MAG: CoA activase, partial [Candidatus Margulisbacteria bacterium]|nr:CoA activase [Candidatus Margulisiibacteriota bacterium]
PYEKNQGETDRLYALCLDKICRAAEGGNGKIFTTMAEINEAFGSIYVNRNGGKPAIGIIGEIFLRCNPPCNTNVIRKIEALGGEAWLAPSAEWGYYTNLGFIYESLMHGKPFQIIKGLLTDLVQKWDDRRLARAFKHTIRQLHEPSILKTINYAAPYLHYTYKGEAVLSIGKTIDFVKKGASGIVNIFPFTCMPGTVVSALAKKVRADHGDFPWLDLAIDGNEGVNLDTRLEAFMHQAKAHHSAHKH